MYTSSLSADQPAKTGEKQAGRSSDGRFLTGRSGNPKGRPPGRRNRAAELFDEVIDEEAFRQIAQKASDLAKEGNTAAISAILRLKVPPPREHAPEPIELPELSNLGDATMALGTIAKAAARSEIDAEHTRGMTAVIAAWTEVFKLTSFEARLCAIENAQQDRSEAR